MGRPSADRSCCFQHKLREDNTCPEPGTTIKLFYCKHPGFVFPCRRQGRFCSPLIFLSPFTFPLPLGKTRWIKTRNSIVKPARPRADCADHDFSPDAAAGHQEHVSTHRKHLIGIWWQRARAPAASKGSCYTEKPQSKSTEENIAWWKHAGVFLQLINTAWVLSASQPGCRRGS